MSRAVGATALYLGAITVFTALMAWSTAGREQEAWTLATALLAAPTLTVGIIWVLLATRRATP